MFCQLGRKRHALVDTDGRGLVIEPHPASVQDRDGNGPLLSLARRSFPFIERVFADAGYAAERVAGATSGCPQDRAQGPQSNRLRRPAATLGCRALFGLDRAQQATSKGLRSHNSLRQSLPLRPSVMLLVRRLARSAQFRKRPRKSSSLSRSANATEQTSLPKDAEL
jgi:putative transposase